MEVHRFILLLLISASVGYASAELCQNSRLTEDERQSLIIGHNFRRQNLANGQVTAKDDVSMPNATNMRELVWDCSLEATAQIYSEGCKWGHSSRAFRNQAGENLYHQYSPRKIVRDGQVENAMRLWWDEVKDMTATTKFTSGFENGKMIGHFTAMGWGNSAKIGCGYANCPPFPFHPNWTVEVAYVVCQYSPGGNIPGLNIYNPGGRCTECWHYPHSMCDNGLCSGGGKMCRDLLPTCKNLCETRFRSVCPISCKTCGVPNATIIQEPFAGSSHVQTTTASTVNRDNEGGGTGQGSGNFLCRDQARNCMDVTTFCDRAEIVWSCPKACKVCGHVQPTVNARVQPTVNARVQPTVNVRVQPTVNVRVEPTVNSDGEERRNGPDDNSGTCVDRRFNCHQAPRFCHHQRVREVCPKACKVC